MERATLELGGLRLRAVGKAGAARSVLLCHGYGAPGDDLVPLAEELALGDEVRWFFPEAPLDLRSLGIPGRAWWPIDMMRLQLAVMTGDVEGLLRDTPPGLAEARAKLEAALLALQEQHGVARERLWLGGFSQGAMLAAEVALHASAPFAGLVLLSGTLVSADRWAQAVQATGPSLKVFQSHGRNDPLLPFSAAERLRALLQGAGAQVEFVAHSGGHELPVPVLRRLREVLKGGVGG